MAVLLGGKIDALPLRFDERIDALALHFDKKMEDVTLRFHEQAIALGTEIQEFREALDNDVV